MKKIFIACIISIIAISSFLLIPKKSSVIKKELRMPSNDFYTKIAYAAEDIIDPSIKYDSSYIQIKYPGGDVPANTGVCSDVVIRTYRKLGIDLQKNVHEDMKNNFSQYPSIWGLSAPDKNIDHRRVYNLNTFFKRKGISLVKSRKSEDYKPGDIVIWKLLSGMYHIGVVSSMKAISGRYYIVHNWGNGQVMEDVLFCGKIYGHYRYKG